MKKQHKILVISEKEWNNFYFSNLHSYDSNLGTYIPTINYHQLLGEGNAHINRKIQFFSLPQQTKFVLFFYLINDLIVAQRTFQYSPYHKDIVWSTSISVDKEYQHQGIATALVQRSFEWAKEHSYGVLASAYEDDGFKWIRHINRRLSKEIGIIFYDKERDPVYLYIEKYYEWGKNNHGVRLNFRDNDKIAITYPI